MKTIELTLISLIVLLAFYVAFRLLKARSGTQNAAARGSRRTKTPQEKPDIIIPVFPGTAEFLQEHPSPDAETRRLQESAVAAMRAGQLETVRSDLEQALARSQARIKENANPYEPIHPQDSTQPGGEKDTVCQLDIIHTEMLLAESVLEEAKNPATDAARSAELREEALRICERIAGEFADDARPEIRAQAVLARFGKSVILGQQGKLEEAVAVHDEIDRRYKEDAAPGVREQVAKALGYKSRIRVAQGKLDAADNLYDEIERRFGQDASPGIRLQVAEALHGKCERLSDDAEIIAISDEIVRRYEEDASPAMRLLVAVALARKSDKLSEDAEAIAIYDEIIRRYGEDTLPATRLFVAMMFTQKSNRLNDRAGIIAICDEMIRRYGEDTSSDMRLLISNAFIVKGEALRAEMD